MMVAGGDDFSVDRAAMSSRMSVLRERLSVRAMDIALRFELLLTGSVVLEQEIQLAVSAAYEPV